MIKRDAGRKSASEESKLDSPAMVQAREESKLNMRERMISAQNESKLRKERAEMTGYTEERVQTTVKGTSPMVVAQIAVKNSDGSYDIKFCNGDTSEKVQNAQYRTTWAVGTWVTVERIGDTWQIVGISPYGAGAFTPPGP